MSATRGSGRRYETRDEEPEVDDYDEDDYDGDGDEADEHHQRPRDPLPAIEAARSAVAHVVELTGRHPIGVTSLQLEDDGWVAEVEVLEDRRIPSTEDTLALYRIELDDDGAPLGYERLGRYPRGRADRREGRA